MMKIKYEFSPDIRENLKNLYKLNNFHAPLSLMSDYLLIAAFIALSKWNIWFYPLTLLFIGSRQRALASLLHESCHKTLTKNRFLNNFMGRWLAGLPIFHSYEAYVKSHVVAHHAYLGDPQRDPDYRHYIQAGLFEVRDRLDFMLGFVLKTIFLLQVKSYLKYIFIYRLGGMTKKSTELFQLIFVQLIIGAVLTLTCGPLGYIKYWLVPFFTTFHIIGWFSEISEHYPIIAEYQDNLNITRNRFPTFLERLFIGMHGDNFHLVHHLFAGIPYWNLGQAHQILLADTNYAEVNQEFGGIFTAPAGRTSVLKQIFKKIHAQTPSPFILSRSS